MKKVLILPVLMGGIVSLFSSVASAATISFSNSIPFTETEWQGNLDLPQYNPADFGGAQLIGVSIVARSNTRGQYVLSNTGGSSFRYGTRNQDVGATVTITGVGGLIVLDPAPITRVGTGTLTATSPPLIVNLNGSDTDTLFVSNILFSNFIGSGLINFSLLAETLIDVTKTGTNFTENGTRVDADLEITVNYETRPLEIPERGFNFLSLVICGLVGLALKTYGKSV